jgi:bis(5'-nucleosyl)-tetraphosphatase (symmetrical)
MARYVIGDIQGCYASLMELLAKINFNPSVDVIYLVGDLVNRGPESLKVLKWAYKHQDSLITVLGNHDIYLLARYNNLLKPDEDETIQDILLYKDAAKLIDWLRHRPLVFHDANYILAHAGVYPRLDFNKLLVLNNAITNHLQANDYPSFIAKIYGNKPNHWNKELDMLQQMKFVINSCTRMRYLNTHDYSLDYKFKGEIANQPQGLIPWFKVEFDPTINKKILFGHWAVLGFYHDSKFISLDTGCAWGRKLTALNLENYEIAQVYCQK